MIPHYLLCIKNMYNIVYIIYSYSVNRLQIQFLRQLIKESKIYEMRQICWDGDGAISRRLWSIKSAGSLLVDYLRFGHDVRFIMLIDDVQFGNEIMIYTVFLQVQRAPIETMPANCCNALSLSLCVCEYVVSIECHWLIIRGAETSKMKCWKVQLDTRTWK